MTKKEIKVKNLSVAIKTGKENDDFICLTDMAKFKGEETGIIIANWLTTKFTLEFIGIWEEMNNPNFNLMEFHKIKNQAGSNGFIVSSSKWINSTNSIGIRSSTGRYGGTYAHKDIAFEFASWLSPEFKLYLIKEFQRLKEQEKQTTQSLEWQIIPFPIKKVSLKDCKLSFIFLAKNLQKVGRANATTGSLSLMGVRLHF